MQIKAAGDRQADILAFERLLERPDVPAATGGRIEAEIRQIQAGDKGERDAAYDIELYFGRSKNWATIHDLRIEVDGLAAQIDHLIINRLAEIWVCESKHFAEGVSVNDHGEWVRWWKGRSEGIPSPIEQNHRHLVLLQRVFHDGLVPPPRRFGLMSMKPDLRSLVLVSNKARIGRARRAIDGIDEVIKVEQLKTRLFDEFARASPLRMRRVIGTEGLESFARDLAGLHRPASFDWPRRFGLPAVAPAAAAPQPSPAEPSPAPWDSHRRGSGHRCASCGEPISFAVVRFCWNNKARFNGAEYCIPCQQNF
jgi:hypothetical protein